jgi:hypothetical protein
VLFRNPITGIAVSCAPAASGHAAAPLSSVMNARRFNRLPALAGDLVQASVSVLFAASEQVALAAKAATATIPTVFIIAGDPVRRRMSVLRGKAVVQRTSPQRPILTPIVFASIHATC